MPPAGGVSGLVVGKEAAICASSAGRLTEIKCEIAVAKGKKLYDKREADKARTADAEARAEVRRRA